MNWNKVQGFLLFFISIFLGIIFVILFSQFILDKGIPLQNPELQQTSQFSIANAPSQSLRGNIVSFLGNVGFEDRVATQAAKLTRLETIQQGEQIVTDVKSSAVVNFPNVLTITISPKTTLNFTQTLPANIVFDQTSGSVNYTESSTNAIPISVRSLDLLVEQTSGSMTISLDPNNPIVTVDVASGSATAAFNDLQYLSHVIPISSGNEFVFHDDTRQNTINPL